MIALHEFLSGHRDEILVLCLHKLKSERPEVHEAEFAARLGRFLGEIIRALQRDAGHPAASPLPGRSESAAQHGEEQQRNGDPIATLSRDFGVLSETMGEVGERLGLCFNAGEYARFNRCLDDGIAAAIERYWDISQAQRQDGESARLGSLAHELRNALQGATMGYEMLRRGQAPIQGRTGDLVYRSLQRMGDLIGQTLTAAQLRASVRPEFRPLPVAALLRELNEAAVSERGITVVVEADEALSLDADERLLTSAVGNLLQNALKFTRPGGRVVLRARADRGAVGIEVEDECGGLPPGQAADLFAPFVQRGQDRRGIGLGLTITREAVHALGGEITVRDLPGKGCVFALTFPQVRPPGEAPDAVV